MNGSAMCSTLCTLSCLAVTATAAEWLPQDKASTDEEKGILWYDAQLLSIEGRGWQDTEGAYDRLPARAKEIVRPPVWSLSRNSAGICARFVTDATTIEAHWVLHSAALGMVHMPATGKSGLDLYVKTPNGTWHWLAVGRPTGKETTAALISGLPAGTREYMLYLPLYNGVSSIEIGIPKGSRIAPGPVQETGRDKPIVFYGTSITQGGCASRPGMVHTAIIGRKLNIPIINLGFSGNGKMETEMRQFFAELDPSVYVLDCLPNMTAGEVTERVEPFVRALREKHPDTPILLVEDRTYSHAFLISSARRRNESSRAALKKAYENLVADGVKGLHYLEGEKLLAADGEDTVDGSHPTDLGFVHQASAFIGALMPLLDAPK